METFNKQQLIMAKERAIEKLNLKEDTPTQATFGIISLSNITSLPLELLLQIFEICNLKDMLNLAKVCKLFRHLISYILKKRYTNFIYSYLKFKFSLNLEDKEISELCLLCGESVTHLRFSTYFNMDLLKHIEWTQGFNPMENLKFFINHNFKQNLQYFPNLQDLEVQGKFVQDITFSELSKRCKKLRRITLLDGDNRWLLGKHLVDLESIADLELKSCPNLDAKHLQALSEKRQLQTLNITECEQLKDVSKMLKLCQNWENLEILRLTAFTQDPVFLKAILSLPCLKCLQFLWINCGPLQFEENFFQELQENLEKSHSLISLKFENDRYYIEDESLQQWTEEYYNIMRETVCISGRLWQWTDEVFEKVAKSLENFTQLKSLNLRFCRLLNYEQLRRLPRIIKSLKVITIYGCPMMDDNEFLDQWLHDDCQLKFEFAVDQKIYMNFVNELKSRQYSSVFRRDPVMSSIECQFLVKS